MGACEASAKFAQQRNRYEHHNVDSTPTWQLLVHACTCMLHEVTHAQIICIKLFKHATYIIKNKICI